MARKKQYIYLVQSAHQKSLCEIGTTNDLEQRLKEYNTTTEKTIDGKSKSNSYKYLLACEVKNMAQVESTFSLMFSRFRVDGSENIYFCNQTFFRAQLGFLISNEYCVNAVVIKPEHKKEITNIIKRITPIS